VTKLIWMQRVGSLLKKLWSKYSDLFIKSALFVIAILLGVLLIPIGLLYSLLFRVLNKFSIPEKLSTYLYSCALAIDQLGNVFCSDLFNHTLVTSDATVLFGDPDQTISAVLGYAQRDNQLTMIGRWIVNLLDTIDPDHCRKAMIKDINGEG